MKELLIELNACQPAQDWAEGKSWKEIYNTCYRGDWLLWLFDKTKDNSEKDFELLTVAKGHCANTVKYLMKDSRSIDAVDAAINYKSDWELLKKVAYATYSASADAIATYAAIYAAADIAADNAAYAAADIAADNAAYAAADIAAYDAAYVAYAASAVPDDDADAALAAADAALAAAYAAYAAAYVTYYAVDAIAYYAAEAEKVKNQQLTADLVRKYIPIENWHINIDLKWE